MKSIGLIGGMSWESTRIYYELINRDVQQRLGGIHSARMIITSLDMQYITELQKQAKWEEAGELLATQARHLQSAGADVIAIAANTMHKCADKVVESVQVPLLHVVDALAVQLKSDNRSRPLLLATRFTMEGSFYRGKLSANGIDALIPSLEDREVLHAIIYDELCRGIVTAASTRFVAGVIVKAKQDDADSVILGCTEICMLIKDASSALPVYDTTRIHARALVDFALS